MRTVLGDIAPEKLGVTHAHEHTFIMPGKSVEVNPTLLLDSVDRTTEELIRANQAGCQAVIDAQPIGAERNPEYQKIASERSGMHIIATTGFHRPRFYEKSHFRFTDSVETLAGRCVHEIEEGMSLFTPDGEKVTSIRAGLLKWTSEYHVITADDTKAAEAVAIAHRETNAPIITHTEMGTCGLEQVQLMEKHGVEPECLILSHMDRNPDLFLHTEIVATGAYLVYDGISRTKYWPDTTIVDLIVELFCDGYGDRLMLGMDMGPRSMWTSYGGGPGMAYLMRRFVPRLRHAGLSEDDIRTLLIENPAQAFAFVPKK